VGKIEPLRKSPAGMSKNFMPIEFVGVLLADRPGIGRPSFAICARVVGGVFSAALSRTLGSSSNNRVPKSR
jgi:hypothetical protein